MTGDPAATFTRLFDATAGPLHAYLSARVGRSAADDLVAETFLVAYRDRERFDPGRGSPRAWLYGIATNLARRHQRSEARALAAVARLDGDTGHGDSGEEGPARVPERLDAASSVRSLAAAVGDLAPGDRDVLLLTAWAELSTAEIADALEIPVGTVRSRLHRVRRQLRTHLDRAEEER